MLSDDPPPPGCIHARRLRDMVAVLLAVLPWRMRRSLGRWLLGWSIAPTARIGLSVIAADKVVLGENARIGHFNVVRSIDELILDGYSLLGSLNWVGGVGTRYRSHFPHQPSRRAALHLGRHSSITSRHVIDCCDLVTIGEFSTIAGAYTQIMSHGIDIETNQQRTGPVSIGAYCYVGTGSILLKFSVLPDYCVLGAASLLNAVHMEKYHLYAGVPARPIKPIRHDSGYFMRSVGRVE